MAAISRIYSKRAYSKQAATSFVGQGPAQWFSNFWAWHPSKFNWRILKKPSSNCSGWARVSQTGPSAPLGPRGGSRGPRAKAFTR